MKEVVLIPMVSGKKSEKIDMGKGRPDNTYQDDWVFYRSGYILVGTKATYKYNIRIARKREANDI